MSEEKRQQKNNKILIIGVSIFAVLFFFLWIFNLQRLIFINESADNIQDQTWQNIQEEFIESFIQMNQVWETAQENEILLEKDEFIDGFKNKLKEENNNLEPLPQFEEVEIIKEEVEGEGETTRSTDHCPEYVNCMPTYDKLPEDFCLVPPDCEDITIKVY
jgi:biopolymer transport protein ExbB/TolQ